MNYITFDIETYTPQDENNPKGVFSSKIDPKAMRTSVVGAYFSWLDKYLVFFEDQVPEFVRYLKYADVIVGFNHIWFDVPALQKYADYPLSSLHCYDILVEFEKKVGYKVKLDDLAKNNLKTSKTDSFANFRTYHLEGKWFELADYCMHDVLITEMLFRMVRAGKPLKYSDMLTTKEVILDMPTAVQNKPIAKEELF